MRGRAAPRGSTRRTALLAAASVAAATMTLAACASLEGLADDVPGLGEGGSAPSKKDASSAPDARASDGAMQPTARCDRTQPFSSPELVMAFDAASDFVKGAVLTPDELEVFYLVYAASGAEWSLRHARRTTRDAAWGVSQTLAATPSPDGTLSLSAGGLKLYFWTIDADYRMTRPTAADAFGVPVMLYAPGTPQPFVVASDDQVYFARYENDATVDRVIRRSSLTTNGLSSTSSVVPNLHALATYDSSPVLNVSETALYFASNRPGTIGLADIWVSRRISKQAEFGAPEHVPELSTDQPDAVTWVSDDECQAYLDRASHVYFAHR